MTPRELRDIEEDPGPEGNERRDLYNVRVAKLMADRAALLCHIRELERDIAQVTKDADGYARDVIRLHSRIEELESLLNRCWLAGRLLGFSQDLIADIAAIFPPEKKP